MAEGTAFATSSSTFLTPPTSPETPPMKAKGRPRRRQLEDIENSLIPLARKKVGGACKICSRA